MDRRDFLKTAAATAGLTATAVLTATLAVRTKETSAMPNSKFADVNGQHIFYSVHGAGKP
ncbi:MAG: twin-arginine translocation signal domain-containing protein, partial [Gemmatimonadaceae bacterium]